MSGYNKTSDESDRLARYLTSVVNAMSENHTAILEFFERDKPLEMLRNQVQRLEDIETDESVVAKLHKINKVVNDLHAVYAMLSCTAGTYATFGSSLANDESTVDGVASTVPSIASALGRLRVADIRVNRKQGGSDCSTGKSTTTEKKKKKKKKKAATLEEEIVVEKPTEVAVKSPETSDSKELEVVEHEGEEDLYAEDDREPLEANPFDRAPIVSSGGGLDIEPETTEKIRDVEKPGITGVNIIRTSGKSESDVTPKKKRQSRKDGMRRKGRSSVGSPIKLPTPN